MDRALVRLVSRNTKIPLLFPIDFLCLAFKKTEFKKQAIVYGEVWESQQCTFECSN